jgi:hypothetical protein
MILALLPARALAQSDAELAQARTRFAEGVRLLNHRQWAPAAERFREVMRVRATPQVKYNLGLALSHMEEQDVRESRRLLRESSEDQSLDAPTRQGAQRRLQEIGPGPEAAPQPIEAGGSEGAPSVQRPFTLELHAGFSFWGLGFVSGARFGIPIVHHLFPSLDDALYLNVGFDFYYVSWVRVLTREYGPGFGIPLTLHWEIYFDEHWSGFLELGAQFFVHPFTWQNDRFDAYEPAFFFIAAIGASLRIHPNVALTLRVGTPFTSFAVTFLF